MLKPLQTLKDPVAEYEYGKSLVKVSEANFRSWILSRLSTEKMSQKNEEVEIIWQCEYGWRWAQEHNFSF